MNLPTREECQEIVKNSDAFYVTEKYLEHQKIEIYDYRMAKLEDFEKYNAYELRGLTFIYDVEKNIWNRFILMNKFFNVNQAKGWNQEDLTQKITRIQNKEDGSIISFVRFSNDNIRAKSKMSFESEQAQMAQYLFMNNYNIRKFVTNMLNIECTAIFELVGYENQIVIEYDTPYELRLLHIRDENGNYYPAEKMNNIAKIYNIETTEEYNVSLIENIASKYTKEELILKLGNNEFQTFDEFIDYLS